MKQTPATRLRRAQRTYERAAEGRDAAIRDAHEAGLSLREIAAGVGLSHPTVWRILHR